MEIIKVLEKPDWITWDEIHDVLWRAHEANRERGINLPHAAFSGQEIKDYLTPEGKMFVALCNGKVIGTAAYIERRAKFWFGEGIYAYCCFASVLPEYAGEGVYRQLMEIREKSALAHGIDKMMFNTHPNNSRVINVALINGFKKVTFSLGGDSPWVYMVKWINGAPYSGFRFKIMYECIHLWRQFKHRLQSIIK